MSYSLLEVVQDGPLIAPRWFHHLAKCATHGAASFALWGLTHHADGLQLSAVTASLLSGPILWLIFALHEYFWPSDPQPLTRWQHWADWATDCTLSCVPLWLVLIARHDLACFPVGIAIGAAYGFCHKDARP